MKLGQPCYIVRDAASTRRPHGLLAHEIDAVKLVTEALAGGERGLEIGLSEHISVDCITGDDR